jgi:hypothetical protein
VKKLATLLLLVLLCGSAYAQDGNLVLLFASEPGTRVAGLQSAQGGMSGFSPSLFDFDGDERLDLVLTSDDSEGNLLGVLVIDAATLDTLWRVVDIGATLGLAERDGMKLYGFADADADADGTREAVFANDRDVWLVDPGDNTLEWVYSVQVPEEFPVLLRAVSDLTDDGFPDLVLFLPAPRQVQVWGSPQ